MNNELTGSWPSATSASGHSFVTKESNTTESAFERTKAAYREAGHAVIAHEVGIRIDTLELPRTTIAGHVSRFARLSELHRLDSANLPHIAAVVRKYVRFLLAGPVAVMLYQEQAQGYCPFSPHRSGFRERILKRQFLSNDPDVDVAYALVLAWISSDVRPDHGANFRDQWTRTIELLECTTLWRRVQRLAVRLLRQHQLQETPPP